MEECLSGNAWFHGKLSGENSSLILHRSSKKDGLFFVRESLTSKNSFVLCIWANNQPHQFRISTRLDGSFSIENGQPFQGLDTLIDHYRKISDGLPCSLTLFITCTEPPSELRKRTETLLHQALRRDQLDVFNNILLDSKSSQVNAQNELGQTVLHIACFRGNCLIVKALLSIQDIDTSLRDKKGCTPLHIACQRGFLSIVKLLVLPGIANLQDRNSLTGWVALHEAVVHGHSDIVETLLYHEAPSRPRTPDAEIPYSLAERYNKVDIMDILERFEVNKPAPLTTSQEWLHPNLSREDANNLLEANGLSQGLFLVRPNSKRAGYYALSLVDNKIPYHFVIVSLADQWFYIDDGPIFSNLPSIITHYSNFADGLPTTLKMPVSPLKSHNALSNIGTTSIGNNSVNRSQIFTSCSTMANASRLHNHLPPISSDYSHISEWMNDNFIKLTQKIPIIDSTQVQLYTEIGSGEFGAVYAGKFTNEGSIFKVAVKTLRQECINSGSEAFLQEAKVMFDLNHNFIVKLLGVCLEEPIMLVQELVINGSLLNYIQLPINKDRLSLDTFKLWAGEIACGMCFLESKRFVHRDLAARNILVASPHVVKISDFGLSRAVGADSNYYKASKGGRWPVKWYAPESVYYGTFSHSSDVWSYGITLWEMFSFGAQPYGDHSGQDVLKLLEEGKRLSIPKQCSESTYNLMNQCWNYDPKFRPSFGQLYEIFIENPEYASVPHSELYVESLGSKC